jgi:triosephosphate isomerase
MNELATPVIAGNWKMHKGPAEAAAFFSVFVEQATVPRDRTVVFFPPAISLTAARSALGTHRDILLGVQNIHWESHGAFTGEISAPMAQEAGAQLVLCGHSERRHVFGETDEEVGRKAAAACAARLRPMICVGEKLDEREAGRVDEVILRQLDAALDALEETDLPDVLLAYEPVWAIGTGRNATPEDAAAAHGVLRRRLHERMGEPAARVPILYGGSVKPDNAAALLAAADVDGLLVGGASLDPAGFARIVSA